MSKKQEKPAAAAEEMVTLSAAAYNELMTRQALLTDALRAFVEAEYYTTPEDLQMRVVTIPSDDLEGLRDLCNG